MKSSVTLFKHKTIITICALELECVFYLCFFFTMSEMEEIKNIFLKWNKRKTLCYTEEPFMTLTRNVRLFRQKIPRNQPLMSITVFFSFSFTISNWNWNAAATVVPLTAFIKWNEMWLYVCCQLQVCILYANKMLGIIIIFQFEIGIFYTCFAFPIEFHLFAVVCSIGEHP